MNYNLGGQVIDIDDSLLEQFRKEMGNISQEMLDSCAKLALVRYNDIKDDGMLKKRVEDVMCTEMEYHQNIDKLDVNISGYNTCDILGYKIYIPDNMFAEHQRVFHYPLNIGGIARYVSVAIKRHTGETLTDKLVSQYMYDEFLDEIKMYG